MGFPKKFPACFHSARSLRVATSIDASNNSDEIVWFDQLGRPWLTQDSDTGPLTGNTAQGIQVRQAHLYGTAARYEWASNPSRQTPLAGDPPCGWTRRAFDGAGRQTEVASFNGNGAGCAFSNLATSPATRQTIVYSGRQATYADEAATSPAAGNPGETRTVLADGVGRMRKVTDATGTTVYGYDMTDDLTSVSQGTGSTVDGTFVTGTLANRTSCTIRCAV